MESLASLQNLIDLLNNKLDYINKMITVANNIGDLDQITKLEQEKLDVEMTLQKLLTLQ